MRCSNKDTHFTVTYSGQRAINCLQALDIWIPSNMRSRTPPRDRPGSEQTNINFLNDVYANAISVFLPSDPDYLLALVLCLTFIHSSGRPSVRTLRRSVGRSCIDGNIFGHMQTHGCTFVPTRESVLAFRCRREQPVRRVVPTISPTYKAMLKALRTSYRFFPSVEICFCHSL